MQINIDMVHSEYWSRFFNYKEVKIEGYVLEPPNFFADKTTFKFLVKKIGDNTEFKSNFLVKMVWRDKKLTTKNKYNRGILHSNYLRKNISVGDYLHLKVKLKKPHNYSNPGCIDIEKFYFRNKIFADGAVVSDYSNNKKSSNHYKYPLSKLREYIKLKLSDVIKSQQFLGVAYALVIGDKSMLEPNILETFKKLGISHLLVISGLHVGFFATVSFVFSRIIWRLFFYKIIPYKIFASYIAIVCSGLYAGIAGFAVATQRAFIMILAISIAVISRKFYLSINILFIALIFCLVLDPFNILDLGFWLSFLAVFTLIFFADSYRINFSKSGIGYIIYSEKILRFFNAIRMQSIVFVLMSIISMYFFGGFSLISPVCNLIFIPLFSFSIVLPTLVTSMLSVVLPTVSVKIFDILSSVFFYMLSLMHKISLFKLAAVDNTFVTSLEFYILIVLAFMFLLLPKFLGKNLSLLCLLPIFFTGDYSGAKDNVTVSVLDVGQGLSVIIRTKNHTVLYDTGPKIYGTNFDAGSKIIIPALNYLKIKKISKVIISHPDLDHSGGYKAIRESINIGETITSEPKYFPYKDINYCSAGKSFNFDNVEFRFYHPGIFLSPQKNDNSCVLKVTYNGQSILLPGDISKKIETTLVRNYEFELQSDVLVVPHHGSKSSSSREFLHAVAPKVALVSAGYLNRFSHPHANIVERYNNLGIRLLNTVDCGMISFNLGQNIAQKGVICYRMVANKFWNY